MPYKNRNSLLSRDLSCDTKAEVLQASLPVTAPSPGPWLRPTGWVQADFEPPEPLHLLLLFSLSVLFVLSFRTRAFPLSAVQDARALTVDPRPLQTRELLWCWVPTHADLRSAASDAPGLYRSTTKQSKPSTKTTCEPKVIESKEVSKKLLPSYQFQGRQTFHFSRNLILKG